MENGRLVDVTAYCCHECLAGMQDNLVPKLGNLCGLFTVKVACNTSAKFEHGRVRHS